MPVKSGFPLLSPQNPENGNPQCFRQSVEKLFISFHIPHAPVFRFPHLFPFSTGKIPGKPVDFRGLFHTENNAASAPVSPHRFPAFSSRVPQAFPQEKSSFRYEFFPSFPHFFRFPHFPHPLLRRLLLSPFLLSFLIFVLSGRAENLRWKTASRFISDKSPLRADKAQPKARRTSFRPEKRSGSLTARAAVRALPKVRRTTHFRWGFTFPKAHHGTVSPSSLSAGGRGQRRASQKIQTAPRVGFFVRRAGANRALFSLSVTFSLEQTQERK